MAKDISILFTLKDHFSGALKNISNNQKNFKKDIQETSKQMAALYDKKHKLQIENKNALKAMKDTAKQADKLGDKYQEVFYEDFKKKTEVEKQLASVNKEIKMAEKGLQSLDKSKSKALSGSESGGASSKLMSAGKWGLLGGIGLIVGAGAAAGAGMVSATKYSLGLAASMEQTSIAFETMLKSKDKSDKFLTSLKSFAISTPFEFNELTDSAKKMLAYGFQLEQIIPTLTAVGNAASGLGLGAEGVDRITIALGQMLAKQKVSGEEMRQLTEAGVPAWDMLSKATGKSTAELMKLSEKGAIPADKAVQALIAGMNQRFPDMMIRQSKTLLGLWSSMKDYVNLNIFSSFGEGIRQGILPYLTKFTDGLTGNQEKMDKFKQKLIDMGKTMGDYVGAKADQLNQYFSKLFNNPDFQNANLGGKVKIVLDDMYASMQGWFDGSGGEKIKATFRMAMEGAINILGEVVTNSGPKLVFIGAQIGTAIGDGMLQAIDQKLPFYDARQKSGLKLSFGNELKAMDAIMNPGSTIFNFFRKSFSAGPAYSEEPAYSGDSRAIGISRVSHDNTPYLLHEGETVLTKQQSNGARGAQGVTIIMNGTVIREEADITKFAKAFVRELTNANLAYGGVN